MQVKKTAKKRTEKEPMIFTSANYRLLGIGIVFIIAGFTAMRIENEVYGLISLYISPVVILAGYIVIIFAILRRSDHKTAFSPQNPE
ncbi:MAG: DUF3098 domain-containing protein [Balneolaceae bacterium]|nr:MAG: DUF3098 domain-containing protein [Balneolaceae bacterium]